jgi:hypothetical protein
LQLECRDRDFGNSQILRHLGHRFAAILHAHHCTAEYPIRQRIASAETVTRHEPLGGKVARRSVVQPAVLGLPLK